VLRQPFASAEVGAPASLLGNLAKSNNSIRATIKNPPSGIHSFRLSIPSASRYRVRRMHLCVFRSCCSLRASSWDSRACRALSTAMVTPRRRQLMYAMSGKRKNIKNENVSSPRSVCQLIRFDPSVFDSRASISHGLRGCQ